MQKLLASRELSSSTFAKNFMNKEKILFDVHLVKEQNRGNNSTVVRILGSIFSYIVFLVSVTYCTYFLPLFYPQSARHKMNLYFI